MFVWALDVSHIIESREKGQIMATDIDRQKDYNEAYSHAWAAYGDYQAEAHKDLQAYLGDIFTAEEKKTLRLRNSDLLNIQLIRPIIKWVAGFQADHRKGIKYDPIEGGDVETANDFTELGTAVMQRNKGYNVITKAFEHALKTGLCLVNVFNDTNFQTKLDHFFYNQFLLDPAWTKLDLSDCNFLMMRKFLTKADAKIILPEEFFKDIDAIDVDRTNTDDKFPNYLSPVQFGHKMFPYDEFQQRDTEQQKFIIVKPTGKEIPFNGTDKELTDIFQLLQSQGIRTELLSPITKTVSVIKVSAFLDGKHITTKTDPFGIGDYSATPIQCFYDPEYDQMKWKLQGMVRSLKDIQRAETKRIISMIAWYENSIANGLDFEEETLVDMEDAFKTGPGPRMFKKGALSGEKTRDRITPPIPGGMIDLHNILVELMPKSVNVNPDMMGLPPDANRAQISGILSEIRIGSGMVGLRGLFDDLSQSQNVIGRKLLKLYQQYPTEKIIRLLGRQPSQKFKESKAAEFDAATAEGMLTDTQRNAQYLELITLIELGAKLGRPFPAEWKDVMELGTLQISKKMLDKISQKEQQQAQQAKLQLQQQNQLQQITIQALTAQMAEDMAQAQERRAQAEQNMASAGFDRAKTIAQIADLESKPIERLLKQAVAIEKIGIEQQKINQPAQTGGNNGTN